ncbi:MAG TPA: PTS sugar transporter subunit IIA, partial [Gammaproteobacteria bacterium]|nr:PTS sugar transporter subunit IIA [Gammaproteobacteria bacterium]
MNLATLISPEAVAGLESVSSKKRSLEQLAALLVDVNPQLRPAEVFDALMERERLGSTALGKGVAIPHARLPDLDRASIAIIKMDKGIDFDAPDGRPVDVLVALVVPDEANEEHLRILASLAELASDDDFLARFRARQGNAALYDLLRQY